MNRSVIYIKPEEGSFLSKPEVKIGDVATVYCMDKELEQQICNIIIYRFHPENEGRAFISVLLLVQAIEKTVQGTKHMQGETESEAEIHNLGAQDLVVSYKPAKCTPSPWSLRLRILLICITCFFGAGVSIMEYNNDVNILKVFRQLYKLFIGTEPAGATFVEFFYSLGLTAGIFLFFNHIPGSKITDEPTPIQVQMRLYEKDINQTFIVNATRSGEELEVDNGYCDNNGSDKNRGPDDNNASDLRGN